MASVKGKMAGPLPPHRETITFEGGHKLVLNGAETPTEKRWLKAVCRPNIDYTLDLQANYTRHRASLSWSST